MIGLPGMGRGITGLSKRGRRALGLMTLALVVIAAAGFAYLYPTLTSRPKAASPTTNLPPVNRSSDLVSYDFVTPSMGWALVGTVTAGTGPGQFSVFRTVDSAKHWQRQLTGPGSTVGVQSIQFFDKTNGLITVASFPKELVYRTTDSGTHWQAVGLPGPGVGVVSFSDLNNGWLLVVMGSPRGQIINLYGTDDGGTTWQRLPDPPPDLAATITFRRPSEGWIGSTGDPLPHVYTSTDGGRSWNRHDLPLPAFGLPASTTTGVFLLPGTGVIAFTGGSFPLTSFDSGASWSHVAPRSSGQSFGDLIGFQDAFHWCAIDGSSLYKSSDAGQTWTQVSNQLPANLYFCQFLDSTHGWGLVADPGRGNGLVVTEDGGLHWRRTAVPQPT
jgi:photosystem II stability/assembly factor-like uncharacterized protein